MLRVAHQRLPVELRTLRTFAFHLMDPLIRCTLKFQDNPQEASTARAGRHPRPVGCVRDMSGSPKSRTELNIGGSGAKNCSEHHGKVRFGVALQKPTKNCKKPILKSTFSAIVHFSLDEQKSRFFFSASHGGVAASASGGRGAAAAAAAAAPLADAATPP